MRFCDIQNNQGRDRCYQPKPKATRALISDLGIVRRLFFQVGAKSWER